MFPSTQMNINEVRTREERPSRYNLMLHIRSTSQPIQSLRIDPSYYTNDRLLNSDFKRYHCAVKIQYNIFHSMKKEFLTMQCYVNPNCFYAHCPTSKLSHCY
ncbi:hypothetical protein NPIL_248331 [Nephila pilipes]|uniref:Uncharacterized protein n=1 Tax=Nephila pilipes TaxID=299642 RepID=A0A8X6NTR8_NEPPI|nr:hypothetical protein NPIL_248331 [Nephila pilipes]